MPQYYAQQPWVPTNSSLFHPCQLIFYSTSSIPLLSHLCHHTYHITPPTSPTPSSSVCAASHCRCFISEGAFSLDSLPSSQEQDSSNTWTMQQSCIISKSPIFFWDSVSKHVHTVFYSAAQEIFPPQFGS